jgi:hypothetical protein
LLTLIEASPVYMVSFGFDKGVVGSVNSGGKMAKDHHRTIARQLFIDSTAFVWPEKDLPALTGMIKNPIAAYVQPFYI